MVISCAATPARPPVVDVLVSEGRVPWAGHTGVHAVAEVYDVIRRSRMTLIFVNTRCQAEFAFQELWRMNEQNLAIGLHHGSWPPNRGGKVEAAMARGDLDAVVCTSTLDLGIDWGDVDLVIQLAGPRAPRAWSSGSAGPTTDWTSPAAPFSCPASRFEMLECQAAREAVAENRLRRRAAPRRHAGRPGPARHGLRLLRPFALVAPVRRDPPARPYRDLA